MSTSDPEQTSVGAAGGLVTSAMPRKWTSLTRMGAPIFPLRRCPLAVRKPSTTLAIWKPWSRITRLQS